MATRRTTSVVVSLLSGLHSISFSVIAGGNSTHGNSCLASESFPLLSG
eukprot:CAMPEP_0183311872 /NCGR_PEP_ID=MMETSP0160_2-20130417/39331_1 /TAXON_ID=2839 ORGANISM="Odontella Sinensis, Strain Grunow 1884" /NCGR_SAMPLE_ID=MMETSP0160_2 /ASSEMBLY_ACC=CAM_ASM_000250 /LENGTH=47 /DNA_ID= /DNA_START= /DNA_END= /DNA_ORIENTATION=